ncbi:MAG: tRNA lysidine(34) synthetase TilS [Candidatus Binatia bacterium]
MGIHGEVLRFIQRHKLLFPRDRLLVAVSGGPDSVAMLHVLYDLREEFALHLEVAHLQHGIRGEEAQEDARFVAELAEKLRLPFHLNEVDLPRLKSAAGKGNLEALARSERYGFFATVARQRELGKIATAHTQDDQAETMLMWFLRGSGLKGLGGMSAVRQLDGVSIDAACRLTVIRPCLGVSKADLLLYLEASKLGFRLDRSNQDPSFLRNWIRLTLMPQLKERMDRHLPSRLAQQAELIQDEDGFLADLAAAELDRIRSPEGIHRGPLLLYNKALQRRLLRRWIQEVRGHLRGLDFQHIDALLALISEGAPQSRLAIPGGWELVKEYETLKLERRSQSAGRRCACYSYELRAGEDLRIQEAGLTIQAQEISPPLPRLPDNYIEAALDFTSRSAKLTMRNFRHGDRFQPLGMAGHKKVKELFIEKRVPLSVRASLPLLLFDDEVVWIPGYARSECRKVTSESKAILHLKAVPIPRVVC